MLVSCFSSNIHLYLEKNSVQKLCKVLEIEFKMFSPVDPKFAFEKIEFKVLHYIQHDFTGQYQRLSKDQPSKIFFFFFLMERRYSTLKISLYISVANIPLKWTTSNRFRFWWNLKVVNKTYTKKLQCFIIYVKSPIVHLLVMHCICKNLTWFRGL